MRSIIRILLLLLFSMSANAQSNHSTEVVIEIRNFSQGKHVEAINHVLSPAFGDSKVVAYCATSGWIVLSLDLSHYRSKEQLLELLKPTGIDYIVKDGATATEVEMACKDATTKF